MDIHIVNRGFLENQVKKKRKIKNADISHPKNFADNRRFSADPQK